MRPKTSKEVGKLLEEYVLMKVRELDDSARLTRGSGCGNEFSDISCRDYIIECKKRNTVDFTIKEQVWNHMHFNLPINTEKVCFMVNENINGKRLVTLDLEDFFRILKEKEELYQED